MVKGAMTLINTIKVLGIHNLEVKLEDMVKEVSPVQKVSYRQVFPLWGVLLGVLDSMDHLELILSLQAHRDMEYLLKDMVLMEAMELHKVAHNQVLVLHPAVTDLHQVDSVVHQQVSVLHQVDSVGQLLDQLDLIHQDLVPISRQPQLAG